MSGIANPRFDMAQSTSRDQETTGWWTLLQQTWNDWLEDNAPTLGAALAYYSAFSLAPLVLIVLGLVGLILGEEAARGEFQHQLQSLVGPQVAEAVQATVAQARQPGRGIAATLIGGVTLLIGASGVFGQLQNSLNIIWEVERPPDRGVWGMLQDRFLSFTLVLGTAFLLLISLILSAAINMLGKWVGGVLPAPELLLQGANFALSFGITTLLFAMIFKWVPDAQIAWKDVWLGAVLTALLFTLGKWGLGIYLGRSAVGSGFGAAGSLVLVLVWVYYSSQVLFFGAEFTQAHAQAAGRRVTTSK